MSPVAMDLHEPPPARPGAAAHTAPDTAFGCARDFLDSRFIYAVISPRARGLSLGVNLNPDRYCNFDCVYCEVDRTPAAPPSELDLEAIARELERAIKSVHSGAIRARPAFSELPPELLQLRHVTLSGDGEPTLCPQFVPLVETVVHLRALGTVPFFKLVLVTNGSGLNRPNVQEGLRYFTHLDEIWIKLDAGTQAYMDLVNRPQVALDFILDNILQLAIQRPVVIQSLFASINGQSPPNSEIGHYAHRLSELKQKGAQIALVQIYSANRPTLHHECRHLSLPELSKIALQVREATGLRVEVF